MRQTKKERNDKGKTRASMRNEVTKIANQNNQE